MPALHIETAAASATPSRLEIRCSGRLLREPEGLEDLLASLPPAAPVSLLRIGAPDPGETSVVAGLRERCERSRRRFVQEFLLDADADGFAALGATPTSLSPVLEASRALRSADVAVRWRIPLLPELVHRLEALFSLARDEDVDPVLVPAEQRLEADAQRFAWDFVRYRLLEEEASRLPPARRGLYRGLEAALRHGVSPTLTRERVAVLEGGPEGARELRVETQPRLGGQAGGLPGSATWPRRLGAALLQGGEMGRVLLEGGRGGARWGLARGRAPRGPATPCPPLEKVLVIGAYGGEHIGDTAILGGVLQRIHERHGTRSAVLLSQRPEHSRHLVAMLDVPVALRVEAYEHPRIRECLAAVDGVVFAGGPLMDLPKQLVRHLYAVSLARRSGKPFVVEGIGAGPFKRRSSEWVGRRLVEMATRISVRTSDDAEKPLVRDLSPEVGRDPAFDYLASRATELTRLPGADRVWIDRLLEGSEGRLCVGVNTRPIRDMFTEGAQERDRVAHTRAVESRFEESLAEGLRRFAAACAAPPCFVFYPMNAIQFGFSDLRSAYRIQRLLGGAIDFRVWQGDPAIDGVVALLRRMDLVVAMRFHAAIFALSQQRRVIGIDYRPGKRDKVGALLADFGQSESCTRIDQLTADWLAGRMLSLGASRSG